jgi:hypothetical protein
VPAADIRALLDALLPEGSAANSRGDGAVAPDTGEPAAPSQRALVIASLLQCPDRDADSSAERSS